MTGQDLINSVRFRLADSEDNSNSNSTILGYLNEGAKTFCSTTGCLLEVSTISADGTNHRFSLTSLTNPINIYNVSYAGTKLYPARIFQVSGWGQSSGTPTGYLLWGSGSLKYIIFNLIPPVLSNGIELFYCRTPVDMTTTASVFDFPLEWAPAIVAYAEFRCRSEDRETGLADRAYNEYEASRQSAHAVNSLYLMGGIA